MHVLLVEDEPFTREMLRQDLLDTGLDVLPVGTAEEGLDSVDREVAPAVVVTDVNLGAGMDGVALAEEARRRWPDVVVLVMTGDERNLHRLPDDLRENCFIKPFEPERLVAAVRRCVWR
ncbi:response regulator [Falsiroseomonas sp. HW251]|uniref:response regulator n=1 Tax=Falsiroseomonas sp. HW251 TaxID=3390998 RepID=UPI003D31B67C